jgi:hypothetical protein
MQGEKVAMHLKRLVHTAQVSSEAFVALTMDSGAFLKAAHDSPSSVHRGAESTAAVVSAAARTRRLWFLDDL